MGIQDLISFDQKTRDYVKVNEGYDPNIYKDTKKIPTTGYGFNLKAEHVRKHIPFEVLSGQRALTQPESEMIFDKVYTQSVNDAEQFVGKETFEKLPENAKQVVIDMSYNMGLTRLNKFKKMKAALQSGDLETAKKEMLDSKYAKDDVPNRAKKNAMILMPEAKTNTEELSSFDKAFKEARAAGKKTFEFEVKGEKKLFNTKLEGEK